MFNLSLSFRSIEGKRFLALLKLEDNRNYSDLCGRRHKRRPQSERSLDFGLTIESCKLASRQSKAQPKPVKFKVFAFRWSPTAQVELFVHATQSHPTLLAARRDTRCGAGAAEG